MRSATRILRRAAPFVVVSVLGCTSSSTITISPTDPNDTIWVDGVAYEPTAIKNQSGRLKVPRSTIYWVLAGETVFVKWSDFHARIPFSVAIWDCNICAEAAARSAGREICLLPDGTRPVLAFADGVGIQFTDGHVTAGPFAWQSGCYAPAATADQDDGAPAVFNSFTATGTSHVASVWDGAPVSGGVTYEAHGTHSASFFTVPQGGHAAVPVKTLAPFVDPATGTADANHWIWSVDTSTDSNGRVSWAENYGGTVAVGHVRVFKGAIVHVFDPNLCFPLQECDVLQITALVVPARIRVFDLAINTVSGGADPFQDAHFTCRSDPSAPSGDGDIDFTHCRGGRAMSNLTITPTYDPGGLPPRATDAPFRSPFTWIAEFDANQPAPTLAQGENLYLEFTLVDANTVH
jgi:hypothetical protein